MAEEKKQGENTRTARAGWTATTSNEQPSATARARCASSQTRVGGLVRAAKTKPAHIEHERIQSGSYKAVEAMVLVHVAAERTTGLVLVDLASRYLGWASFQLHHRLSQRTTGISRTCRYIVGLVISLIVSTHISGNYRLTRAWVDSNAHHRLMRALRCPMDVAEYPIWRDLKSIRNPDPFQHDRGEGLKLWKRWIQLALDGNIQLDVDCSASTMSRALEPVTHSS